jgi:hypothetical protein
VDHFLDHQEFALVLRFEFADLAVEETVEFFGRFAGDEDWVGKEGVAGVALAAFGFSFFRGAAGGVGSVGPGGVYLRFRYCFWFLCGKRPVNPSWQGVTGSRILIKVEESRGEFEG